MRRPAGQTTGRIIFIIIAIALMSYLIGNERVSLWDRDEPRYAQTSRQMLQSGDWVVPTLYDTPRTAKPVLIYWCQAASMKLFGDTAAAARLPSAIAMTLTLGLLAFIIPGRRGMWTVFILASSMLVFWAAKSALTDAVLLLFVTVAQLCLYALWRGNRSWGVVIIMAIAVGLGGLTKGPPVLAFPGMTALALWLASPRRKAALRASRYAVLRFIVALGIIAAIAAPWCFLVEKRSPGFLLHAIGKEVVDRARNPQEGHSGPPGYYLVTIWAMFFPWSLLLPATLITAWRNRRLPHVRFALAAIVGPWIMFELIRTKLPHYLLPVYPFLAFLTADTLIRAGRGSVREFVNKPFVRITCAWAILIALGGLLPWIALRWFPVNHIGMFALAGLSLVMAEYGRNVYVSFRAKQPLIAAAVMGIGMFVIVIGLHIALLPELDFLQISRRTADVLKASGATIAGEEIMIDYKEPSLAFYQGGTIREESRNDYLAMVDPIFWPMWIVTTRDVWGKAPQWAKARLEIVQTVRGFDYAGRGVVDVMVLRRR